MRLAYKLSVNNGSFTIYIDAITGENLGGSISKSVDAKAFAYSNFALSQESANLAHDWMARLGWNTVPSYVANDASLGTEILNWWNSSTAYVFYVDCHGSPTVLADATEPINATWMRSTAEVSGNWHFVFLDACNTAVDTRWANAFKTIGYSKRGFLGWYDTVQTGGAFHFGQFFWPEVVNHAHSSNIYDAAVWSAAQVIGEYTPIGYSGNGRAW